MRESILQLSKSVARSYLIFTTGSLVKPLPGALLNIAGQRNGACPNTGLRRDDGDRGPMATASLAGEL